MKSIKYGKNMFLIAQKKRPDALNATQKTPAPYKVWFLKNQEKPFKKTHFNQNGPKWQFFKRFFLIV